MIIKIKSAASFLLLALLVSVASCDKNDDPSYDPITLSYAEDGFYFDNESRNIQLVLSNQSLPILINGGDGHYTITINNPELIGYEIDNRAIIIQGNAIGEGSITIEDRAGNRYTLKVSVINALINKIYTYPYIITDGMDPQKKSELEQKIIDDAPTGGWNFGMPVIIEGERSTARRYMTTDENSEYKEYRCICKREYPANEKPFLVPTQIVTWFTMKSDNEEFVLYLCQPFMFDDHRMIRGYNLIMDVTNRYIDEYPEITRAYEVQSGYPQRDFE